MISIVNEAYQVLTVSVFIHQAGAPGHSGSPAEKFADVCNLALLVLVLAYPGVIFWIYRSRLKHARPDWPQIWRIRKSASTINKTNPGRLQEMHRSI